jgi:hypothetical protein
MTYIYRHCERSESIQYPILDCRVDLRSPRNDNEYKSFGGMIVMKLNRKERP